MESSFIGGYNVQGIKLKRVLYEGTAVIYEGMALCYNQDSVLNMNDVSAIEGTQNPGKWTRVEVAKAANMPFFAGVVSGSAYAGKTGPRWLDIAVPNGAIVACRGTESFTIGDDVYIAAADYEVTNVPQAGGKIGVAMETIDRSGTEGLVLVKLIGTGASGDIVTTATKTQADSAVALTVADAGSVYDNTGATGSVEFDLPTAASCKGLSFTFTTVVAETIVIDPNGTELILFGNGSGVLGAGEALTLTPGDTNDNGTTITIVSNGTSWVVTSAFATSAALFVIP